MAELTDGQRRVFDFVRESIQVRQVPPSVRDICAHFGWKSPRAAAVHLEALVRKGWLVAGAGKARSLRLAGAVMRAAPPAAVGRGEIPWVEIPLLGTIPAGLGRDREQEEGECVPVTIESIGFKPTRNTFALRVAGDSMIGRHICDGDMAIFEHGPEPRHGQVVAALIDRRSTLKTFVLKGGKPFLKAENPRYPDLIPSEELVIQGVFRALIRRAKE